MGAFCFLELLDFLDFLELLELLELLGLLDFLDLLDLLGLLVKGWLSGLRRRVGGRKKWAKPFWREIWGAGDIILQRER